MPKDMKGLIQKDPQQLNFLDPENLPKLSHKQLCCDMGLTVMNKSAEHALDLIQLSEYPKSSLSIGPFDVIEIPTLVLAIHTEQVVGCVGGNGDAEHVPLWFCCKERFLYRHGECDRISMLVRVMCELPEDAEIGPVDPH